MPDPCSVIRLQFVGATALGVLEADETAPLSGWGNAGRTLCFVPLEPGYQRGSAIPARA